MRTGRRAGRAVADELVRAHGRERGDRIDERDEARLGEPGGEADHVLLGHADVEEAAGMRSANGSSTVKPRSPVRSTIRSSLAASSVSCVDERVSHVRVACSSRARSSSAGRTAPRDIGR